MPDSRYLSAKEAASRLGVSLPTLYSYVSRGLIRSEAAGGSRRERFYHAEDVNRLVERKEQRRNPAAAVEQALHWGAPVLESAITLIVDGRLYYRGLDAADLSTSASFEQVAALLWTGSLDTDLKLLFPPEKGAAERAPGSAFERVGSLPPIEAMQTALALAAAGDPSAYDFRTQSVARAGGRILRVMARIACGRESEARERRPGGIAAALQSGWKPGDRQAAELLEAALILCADHELNISAFTARCAASAGSTPYQAVIAGLAALQGTRHGGYVRRVEALFQEASTPQEARRVLTGRLQRGEEIPGFGHNLYPQGDPRGRKLIELVGRAYPGSSTVTLAGALAQEALELIGERPTIDFGLVLLSRALELPAGSALALFALGRTAGWIAQAIEQYQQGRLIRPRARYVGPEPQRAVKTPGV